LFTDNNCAIIVLLKGSLLTIFFNIKTLEKESGGDPYKLVFLIHYLAGGDKPVWYKGSISKLTGFSFINNAKPLSANLDIHDPMHIVQYIKLLALRDYSMYKRYGVTYLDTSYYPDLATANISANPLITITQNKIYFKYEEIYNGIKVRRHQG
jgi:hypothetical protein